MNSVQINNNEPQFLKLSSANTASHHVIELRAVPRDAFPQESRADKIRFSRFLKLQHPQHRGAESDRVLTHQVIPQHYGAIRVNRHSEYLCESMRLSSKIETDNNRSDPATWPKCESTSTTTITSSNSLAHLSCSTAPGPRLITNQNRKNNRNPHPVLRRRGPRHHKLGHIPPSQAPTSTQLALSRRPLLHRSLRQFGQDTARRATDDGSGPAHDSILGCQDGE